MKYSIADGKLFLKAENETDNAILSAIWQHPLIMEYTRNRRVFGDNRFLSDELITSAPRIELTKSYR